jgi:hypothetical protein
MKTAALVIVSLFVLVSPSVARLDYQDDKVDWRDAGGKKSTTLLLLAQNEAFPKVDRELKDGKVKKPSKGGDDPKPGPVLNDVGPKLGDFTKAIEKFFGSRAQ